MTEFKYRVIEALRNSEAIPALPDCAMGFDGTFVERNGRLMAVVNPFAVSVTDDFFVEVVEEIDGFDPTTTEVFLSVDDKLDEKMTEETLRAMVVKRILRKKLLAFSDLCRRWLRVRTEADEVMRLVVEAINEGDMAKYEEARARFNRSFLVCRPCSNKYLFGIYELTPYIKYTEVEVITTGCGTDSKTVKAVERVLPVLSVSADKTGTFRVSVSLSDALAKEYAEAKTAEQRTKVCEIAHRSLVIGQEFARDLEKVLKNPVNAGKLRV